MRDDHGAALARAAALEQELARERRAREEAEARADALAARPTSPDPRGPYEYEAPPEPAAGPGLAGWWRSLRPSEKVFFVILVLGIGGFIIYMIASGGSGDGPAAVG